MTFVDLKEIDDAVAEVNVVYADDGETSRLLWHPDQLTDIPDRLDLQETGGLEEAMVNAIELADKAGDPTPLLDRDADGCPNVSETCMGGGTLLSRSSWFGVGPDACRSSRCISLSLRFERFCSRCSTRCFWLYCLENRS